MKKQMSIHRKIALRKILAQRAQMIGIGLLIVVGVAFFITLFTIGAKYEDTADAYFKSNRSPQLTLYGRFTPEQVKKAAEHAGVVQAAGRVVLDYKEKDKDVRVVTLTEGINIPHLYQGEMPEKGQCLLLNRNAEAMKKKIGDAIEIGGKRWTISGLIASPEYIYLVQSKNVGMAQGDKFAVLYVNQGELKEAYNEILLITEEDADNQRIAELVSAISYVTDKEQDNYVMYRADLKQIRSFAYIFPSIFAILIAVMIYVMLARAMTKDQKQIGIYMSLGTSSNQIRKLYLTGYLFMAVPSACIGGLIAILLCNFVIEIFKTMFEVPTLQFGFYPLFWIGAIGFTLLLCMGAVIITMKKVLTFMPAEAMRMRKPKGGKKIWIERVSVVWNRCSFHTRYAIKNAIRNKGRFFAVVLGICAASGLIVFSLGFYDSIQYTVKNHVDTYANYDSIVTIEPMPIQIEHLAAEFGDESQKGFLMPVKIKNKETTLTLVEDGFDMLKIDIPKDGVVIPRLFADEWDVEVGDELVIEEKSVNVSSIISQNVGMSVYADMGYMNKVNPNLGKVYNLLFLRAEDAEAMEDKLLGAKVEFTTLKDDKESLNTIIESMSVLIWILVGCSVILGMTVLYSVGLVTLAAREYEYMFLGVMGYSLFKMIYMQIKETMMQFVLAVPIGCVAGNLLIHSIKGEFSSDELAIEVTVLPLSYVIAIAITIAMLCFMTWVMARYIAKLDIVQGLKVQEE